MPVLTRRQAMVSAVAALLTDCPREAGADAPPALRDLATAKGILYGSCVQEATTASIQPSFTIGR